MQALKALVIFMGILIFAGMGLLVYGLMTRVGGDGDDAPDVAAKPFGLVEHALPAGATVAGISIDKGRAIVDVRTPGGGAELHLFDLATGAPSGTIRLKAAP
jgi:hypothetical protein